MRLFGIQSWIKSAPDRDIIARRTVGRGQNMTYALELPPPADPARFRFLALGDTGDSEAAGPDVSPQDAVARELLADAALPTPGGDRAEGGEFILHTGDVVYMTGERRLYDRCFRQPYEPLLTPDSTVDHMVFRIPFLPVPGNHDYYDLHAWSRWLSTLPIVGDSLRTLAAELFAFSIPEGGSDMGRAYMSVFVDEKADTRTAPLAYWPGRYTRLPNRYYRFSYGLADFFALDTNSLDAPAPEADAGAVRADAKARIKELEEAAAALDDDIRDARAKLDAWRREQRDALAADADARANVIDRADRALAAMAELEAALVEAPDAPACHEAVQRLETARAEWTEARQDIAEAPDADAALAAIELMDDAGGDTRPVLRALEGCLAVLPETPLRRRLQAARDALQQSLREVCDRIAPAPDELASRIHGLSEDALDVQRELALARRRARFRPADYDHEQLEWLEAALAESERERPDAWRIVYGHHPLYTSIANHCERPDVRDVRDNLLGRLAGRAHLYLSGHAHAFEWFRTQAAPNLGIVVTGGGGQVTLRRSVFDPNRIERYRSRYEALRDAGVEEAACAGRGPDAADGEDGTLYHYLDVEVTPEVIRVRPVGVRALGRHEFRREQPMPVYYSATLGGDTPSREARAMAAIEIRRDAPPVAAWADGG